MIVFANHLLDYLSVYAPVDYLSVKVSDHIQQLILTITFISFGLP